MGDNKATLANVNIDYVTTSRDDVRYECAILEWAIRQTSQTLILTMGVFDWASSVTYVLTDWTFLTILYSTGTGNEAM